MRDYIFAIALCVFITFSYSYNWSLTRVEPIATGTSGYPYLLKMAVTSDGTPHIVYRNNSGSNLRHSYYVNGSWTSANVGSGYNPQFIWACADPNDNIHVSYYDNGNTDLRYLKWTNATSSWQATPTVIDTLHTIVGQYTSIASDNNGNIGIAYLDYYHSSVYYDDLWFAYYNGTNWTKEAVDVDASEKDGYNTAIVFDSNGYAHIVYGDTTNNDLKYATNKTGSWVVSRIDTGDVVRKYGLGIAIDDNDNLYVCYYHNGNNSTQDLYFAYYDGSTWSREPAATTGNVGKFCSIDINSGGSPHIAYFNDTQDTLELAYKVGNTWYNEVVDGNKNSGLYGTSIDIDANNNIHIGYLINSGSSGYVGYAFAPGPTQGGPPPGSYFDINYNSPNSGYYTAEIPNVDFNVATSNPDLGANLQIYLSSSPSSFETLIDDVNLLNYVNIPNLNCADANFMDSTRCNYDMNVVGIVDGNYYIDLNFYNSKIDTNASSTGSILIDNTAPSVSSVSMNSENELTGSSYTLTATIFDSGSGLNGNVTYKCWSPYSSESACNSESWDCHLGDMLNTAGNSYSATVNASVKDSPGLWTCKVYATDNVNLSNSSIDTETMQMTTGITIDSSTATYSGKPGSSANPILTNKNNAYILITHNGNTNINVSITGSDFICGPHVIPKNAQRFNLENKAGTATPFNGNAQTLLSAWSRGAYPESSIQKVWLWMNIPFGTYHGEYTSTITLNSS